MLKQAAENTIGFVKKTKKSTNEDVKELSLRQRIIKNRIGSGKNEERRTSYELSMK